MAARWEPKHMAMGDTIVNALQAEPEPVILGLLTLSTCPIHEPHCSPPIWSAGQSQNQGATVP